MCANPLSSAAERRTHNPEVGGSKPPGGKSSICAGTLGSLLTDMAQRQRAGLITLRSLDRNGLSVSFQKSYKHMLFTLFNTNDGKWTTGGANEGGSSGST